jgi:thymidylate synthase (FAD)
MKMLDHGEIELLDYMGNDLHIVNAARQSFGQASTELGEKEVGLINFLMRERHGTPFEMVQFMFQVKCPIFVAREWFRHRIASYNEYSGRYTKMMAEYYIPAREQMRKQTGKPGAYTFEPLSGSEAAFTRLDIENSCRGAWRVYEELLARGVAKEVARMHLPVNMYTQFTWSINLRSLFNFISLRSHETAMWEIRQYSKTIEDLIRPIVPTAFEAFEKHGRTAP